MGGIGTGSYGWDGHSPGPTPTFYRWFGVVDEKLCYQSTSNTLLFLKADLEFSHRDLASHVSPSASNRKYLDLVFSARNRLCVVL